MDDVALAALLSKLGVRAGMAVTVLGDLPTVGAAVENGAIVACGLGEHPEVVIVAFRELAELEREIGRLAAAVYPDAALWIAWPKRASGVATDLRDDVVRGVALVLGIVDNKVCSIDATWSALRFVWRTALRAEQDAAAATAVHRR